MGLSGVKSVRGGEGIGYSNDGFESKFGYDERLTPRIDATYNGL